MRDEQPLVKYMKRVIMKWVYECTSVRGISIPEVTFRSRDLSFCAYKRRSFDK